jgi:hypothetical protein
MANEKYVQVPFDNGYFERLARRAEENDRVVSREVSRIVKDVLDGRYVRALPGMEVA